MKQVVWMTVAGLLLVSCGSAFPDRVSFDGLDATLWRGGEHCGWDDTWYVLISDDEFDADVEEGYDPVYVRDPDEIDWYEYAADSQLDATLPASAENLAVSQEGYEIWADDGDDTLIYIVWDDGVEAWALSPRFAGCE